MFLSIILACTGGSKMTPPQKNSIPKPPDVEQQEHIHTEHNIQRSDPYYWLREKTNPKVISYLEQENAYTDQVTKHLVEARTSIYDEMLARINENDISVPVEEDGFWYYRRTEEGKPYAISCRKTGSLDAKEEIILDQNELAKDTEYFSLGGFTTSHDHNLLAYATDTTGNEVYTLHIKNLQTGELLEDTIPDITGSITFSKDDQYLFYTTMDESLRPNKLHRHKIGTPASEDVLVYEEKDEKFRIYFWESRSEEFLLLYSASSLTTEYRYLQSDNPTGEFQVFTPRHEGHEYSVEHQGSRWLIVSNDSNDEQGEHDQRAQNFKLMSTSLDQTDISSWQEVIPHRTDVQLMGIDGFKNHFVIFEREGGLEYMRIVNEENNLDTRVPMPEPVFSVWGSSNPNYDSQKYRYGYTSLTAPTSYYEYEIASNESTLLKEIEVFGYNRSDYTSERIWATSHDGTQIPMSIVYKKDLDRTKAQRLYLYGYGSYGMNLDPYFSSTRLSLLNRDVIFVVAHPRGGGEMGREWYENGKFLKKKNTFLDFISCAEHLINNNYTSSDQLIISGGSAGGLLIGATINMKPELFMAAVADVPFVDVVTTMLDESIPLTTNEWEEWGNPAEKEYFDYMLSYSPYDNVTAQNYPHLLVTSGLNDPRVQYWEPTKWVAKLRDEKTDDNVLILKTNMSAGHGGASGRYGRLKEVAFEYAFLLDLWGKL